ncbi:4270_t:CDS:10 [Acaulospora colombiana]|uniref:4270_t:CDS:1 n=1 Tax=Acaulospora colombiana TaxID=27376 RepID=A0ACA9K170_9GLOM|nr:4270_t:CDS:10 [Acaulospora colombiana]
MTKNDGKSIIVVAAAMDSRALFHDLILGVDNGISGTIAVLAVADALSRSPVPVSSFPKHILYTLFTGEAWGFAGSQRFVKDISTPFVCKSNQTQATVNCPFTGVCSSPCIHDKDFEQINFERIDSIFEFSQVGINATGFYAHVDDPNNSNNKVLITQLERLSAMKNNHSSFVKSAYDGVTGRKLPPSSSMAFLEKNRSLAAVVLGDFQTSLRNYYNSEYDDGSNDITSVGASICSIANVTAQAVWLQAQGINNATVTPISVNCDLVEQLLYCLVYNYSCTIVESLYNAKDTGRISHYAGVFQYNMPSDISFFAFNYLSNLTASSTSSNANCVSNKDCDSAESCVAKKCTKAFTRYHSSYGAGFDYDQAGNLLITDPTRATWAEISDHYTKMASQESEEIDKEKLRETCRSIVRSADLRKITMKQVRRAAESELDLKENILDSKSWKNFVTDIVNEAMGNGQDEDKTSEPKKGKKLQKTSKKLPDEKKAYVRTVQSKGTKEGPNKKDSKELEDNTVAAEGEVNNQSREGSKTSGITTQEGGAFGEIFGPMIKKNSTSKSRKLSKDSERKSKIERGSSQKRINTDQPKRVKKEESYSISDSDEATNSGQIHRDSVDSGDDNEQNYSKDPIHETSSIESDARKGRRKKTRRKRSLDLTSDDEGSDSGDDYIREKRMVHGVDVSVKSDSVSSSVTAKKHKSSQESKRKVLKKQRPVLIRDSDSEDEVKERLKPRRKDITQHQDMVEDGGSVMALENKVAKESDQVETFVKSIKSKGSLVKAEKRNSREVEVVIEKNAGDSDSTIQGDQVEVGGSDSEGRPKGFKNLVKDEDAEEMSDDEKTRMSMNKHAGSSDDLSVLDDDSPPRKKRKSGKAKSVVDTGTTEDNDEATIKELKSFIVKCGVRKVWQVKRVGGLRLDLKSNPQVKPNTQGDRDERELEVEMNSIDVGNIIPDDEKESRKSRASRGIFNPTGRRTNPAVRQTSETEEKEESLSEKTDGDM